MTADSAATPAGLAVQVLLGRADDLRAELVVEVRLPPEAGAKPTFEAAVSGPESIRSTTLPVRLPVRTVGVRETADGRLLLGRVVLTEPAYWTPDLPMQYRIAGRLVAADGHAFTIGAVVGLRRLGIRGQSLWLDGRRWVPRGVACAAPGNSDSVQQLEAVVQQGLVAVIDLSTAAVESADDAVWSWLAAADRQGWPVMVRLAEATPAALVQQAIARLAGHAAVLAVVLAPGQTAVAPIARLLAGTMLLAVEGPADQPPRAAPEGVDFQIVRLRSPADLAAAWRRPAGVPAVACLTAGAADRRACDRLQADLAAWRQAGDGPPADWDWAGFLVGCSPTASRNAADQ